MGTQKVIGICPLGTMNAWIQHFTRLSISMERRRRCLNNHFWVNCSCDLWGKVDPWSFVQKKTGLIKYSNSSGFLCDKNSDFYQTTNRTRLTGVQGSPGRPLRSDTLYLQSVDKESGFTATSSCRRRAEKSHIRSVPCVQSLSSALSLFRILNVPPNNHSCTVRRSISMH